MNRTIRLSLLVAVVLASSPARGDDRETLVQDVLQRLPDLPHAYVEIPLIVYERYLRESAAGPQAPKPPTDAWIERAAWTVKLDGSQATVRLELIVAGPPGMAPATVHVLPASVAWTDVTLDDKKIDLLRTPDGVFYFEVVAPAVPPVGAGAAAKDAAGGAEVTGRHILTAKAILKSSAGSAPYQVAWSMPFAAWTTVAVESAEAWEVKVSGAATPIVGTEPAARGAAVPVGGGPDKAGPGAMLASGEPLTRGLVGVVPNQNMSITWQRPQPPVHRAARVEEEAQVGWTIADGVHQVRAILDLRLWGGEAEELSVRLPPGADRVAITGPDVRDVQVQGGAARVFLRGAITQRTRLNVSFEVPRAATGRMTLPEFGVAGATHRGGTLVVAGGGDAVLLEQDSPGLTPMAIREAAPETVALVSAAPVYVYALGTAAWEARVDLVGMAEFPVRETLADSALYTVLVRPDGSVMTKVVYEVRNRAQQYMKIELPPGAQLVVARVSEQQKSLAAGPDGSVLVPLEKSLLTTAGLVSFPVELVYLMGGAKLDRSGKLRVALPRTDLPVAYARAALVLPDGLTTRTWQGVLREVPGRWSSETAEAEFEYGRGHVTGTFQKIDADLAAAKATGTAGAAVGGKPGAAVKPEPAKPKSPGLLESLGGLFAKAPQNELGKYSGYSGPSPVREASKAPPPAPASRPLPPPATTAPNPPPTGLGQTALQPPGNATLGEQRIDLTNVTTTYSRNLSATGTVAGNYSISGSGATLTATGTSAQAGQPIFIANTSGNGPGTASQPIFITSTNGNGTDTGVLGNATSLGANAQQGFNPASANIVGFREARDNDGDGYQDGQAALLQGKNAYRAGTEQYTRGNYAKARDLFQQAVTAAPQSSEAENAKKYLANIDVVQGKGAGAQAGGGDRSQQATAKMVQKGQQEANADLLSRQRDVLVQAEAALQQRDEAQAEAAYRVAVNLSTQLQARGEVAQEQRALVRPAQEFLKAREDKRQEQSRQLVDLQKQVQSLKGDITQKAGKETAEAVSTLVGNIDGTDAEFFISNANPVVAEAAVGWAPTLSASTTNGTAARLNVIGIGGGGNVIGGAEGLGAAPAPPVAPNFIDSAGVSSNSGRVNAISLAAANQPQQQAARQIEEGEALAEQQVNLNTAGSRTLNAISVGNYALAANQFGTTNNFSISGDEKAAEIEKLQATVAQLKSLQKDLPAGNSAYAADSLSFSKFGDVNAAAKASATPQADKALTLDLNRRVAEKAQSLNLQAKQAEELARRGNVAEAQALVQNIERETEATTRAAQVLNKSGAGTLALGYEQGGITRKSVTVQDHAVTQGFAYDQFGKTGTAQALSREGAVMMSPPDEIRTIPLKNSDASSVAAAVQSFFDQEKTILSTSPGGAVGGGTVQYASTPKISVDTRSNAIIVSAPARYRGTIDEVIAEMDSKAAPSGGIHTAAQRPSPTSTAAGAATWGAYYLDSAGGNDGIGYVSFKTTEPPEVAVSPIKSPGSIEVSARRSDLPYIEHELKQMESPSGAAAKDGGSQLKLVPLKNADARQVAAALQSLFSSSGPRGGGGGPSAPSQAKIEAETTTNSLIISAAPGDWTTIEKFLTQLDGANAAAKPTVAVSAAVPGGSSADHRLAWAEDEAQARERQRLAANRTDVQAKVRQLWDRATELRKSSQFAEALDIMDRLLAVDPTDERALRWRQDMLFALSQQRQVNVRQGRESETVEALRQPEEPLTVTSNNLRGRETAMRYPGAAESKEVTERQRAFMKAVTAEPTAVAETRRRLSAEIDLDFQKSSLDNVLKYIGQVQPGLNIVISPDIAASGIDLSTKVVDLKVKRVSVETVFGLILGGDLGYSVQPGYVLVMTRAKLQQNLPIATYPVQDMVAAVPDFGNKAPRFEISQAESGVPFTSKIPATGGLFGAINGIASAPIDLPSVSVQDAEGFNAPRRVIRGYIAPDPQQLLDIIKKTVNQQSDPRVAAWDDEGGTAHVDFLNGNLILTQTPRGQERVTELLQQLAREKAAGPARVVVEQPPAQQPAQLQELSEARRNLEKAKEVLQKQARTLDRVQFDISDIAGDSGEGRKLAEFVGSNYFNGTTNVTGGTLDLNGSSANVGGIVANGGQVTAVGTGRVGLTSGRSWDGGTTHGIEDRGYNGGGDVNYSDIGKWSSDYNVDGADVSYDIYDSQSFTQNLWSITGRNTFTGGTVVNAGAIQVNDGNLVVPNDPAAVAKVREVLDRLRANRGQRVAVGSRNVYLPAEAARAAGIRFKTGANGVRYALINEGQLLGLMDVEQRQGNAAPRADLPREQRQEAVVGTQATLANGGTVAIARAADDANTLSYNGNDLSVAHDDYLVLDNGGYLTAVASGRMQYWGAEVPPVRFPGVPAVVVVPVVGHVVKFEKTLLDPSDTLELVTDYTWEGVEK